MALEDGALRLADDIAPGRGDASLDRTSRRVVRGQHQRAGDHRRPVADGCRGTLPRLQPGGRHLAGHEHRIGEDLDELVTVGGDAVDPRAAQRGDEHPDRLLAGGRPGHHLGEHRVVERGHLVAGAETAVDPNTRGAQRCELGVGREVEGDERTALRRVGRVLCVEPYLDRMPTCCGRRSREVASLGHRELQLDEVHPGHQLGHRVLHLEASVHLEEEEAVRRGVVEELDRARAAIADAGGQSLRGLAHRRLGGCREPGGRGLLDDLLVAALDRAVASTERRRGLLAGHDLHLDVAPGLDVRLDEDGPVAERTLRLGPGGLDLGLQPVEGAYDAHAAPAATRRGLHHQRQVGLGRLGRRREHRDAGPVSDLLGADLVAHRRDHVGRGADPGETGIDDGAGEVGILGQEAIAGVDRVGPRQPSCRDDQVDAEIGVRGGVARKAYGVVGLRHEGQAGVGVGVDGDRLDAETATGREDAARDLPAVGDQKSGDHAGSPRWCSWRSEAGEGRPSWGAVMGGTLRIPRRLTTWCCR